MRVENPGSLALFMLNPLLVMRLLRSLLGMLVLSAVCLMILPAQRAVAFDQLDISLGSLSGPDWQAEQLRFTLDWGDPTTAYRLQIAQLRLPSLEREFNGVIIDCQRGVIETQRIACDEGKVTLPDSLLDNATMALGFELDRASGRLVGQLQKIALAGGSLDLRFQLDGDNWQLQANSHGLKLETLSTLWPQFKRHLADWSLAGRIDLDGQLSGRSGKLRSAQWQGRLSQLSLGDMEGLYAAEGVALSVTGQLASRSAGWRIKSTLSLQQGELLSPYFYLDASAHPVTLRGVVESDPAFTALALQEVTLSQPGLLDLQMEGDLSLLAEQPVERLKLQLAPLPAAQIYDEMLQPVLAGTAWGRFELAGEIGLLLDLQGEAVQVEIGLKDFSLDDMESDGAVRRLGLYDANGRLYWGRGGEARTSHLSWQAGQLLEHIDIGPAEVEFQAADKDLKLTRQLRVPVLDGALVVDRLDLQALGSDAQSLQFDGYIEPISMTTLSQALGWVPLSGKLSGMLPGLKYKQGLLSVEGVLLVSIFDGDILIRQLKTRDLFGVYPQLSADIELRELDLESLTRTFSFGRITGRLEGYVRDLKLEDWSPVAFDARFYTPESDDSRHRISQKAVDNISNLGGAGLSGSLARSFLRFFEEFSYKQIGIGCRLQNEVCEMTGAGKAKQGYYLVEGSGIPRIDIIGFNSTADWSSLVEQLKQISEQEAPTVE